MNGGMPVSKEYERDSNFIKALSDGEAVAVKEQLSILEVLQSHPIIDLVRTIHAEQLERYPAISGDYEYSPEIPYMCWSLPGRDNSSVKRGSCGINRSKDAVIISCCNDRKDYTKLAGMHCWRLACTNCISSEAIRRGSEAEGRIYALHDIGVRKNGTAEEPVHIVLSPPQEWALQQIQHPESYRKMYDKALKLLKRHGIHSGAAVFHPWRLDDDCKNWRAGPHFHIIGYGWLDSVGLYNRTKWIAEKIHPNEPLRSVRLTMSYLLTHAGLCTYPSYDEGSGEWDLDIDLFDIFAEMKSLDNGSGKIDMNKFDYATITIRRLKSYFQTVRQYGGLSRNQIRTITELQERRERKCYKCGSNLMMYNGLKGRPFDKARYTHKSRVFVTAEDYAAVANLLHDLKGDMKEARMGPYDVAVHIPHCSSPETAGFSEYKPGTLEGKEFSEKHLKYRLVYLPQKDGSLKPVRMTQNDYKQMIELGISVDS